MKRYLVVIDWKDGDFEDSSEISVHAASAAGATSAAKSRWRMTIGAQFPQIQLIRSFVLTPERLLEFA